MAVILITQEECEMPHLKKKRKRKNSSEQQQKKKPFCLNAIIR